MKVNINNKETETQALNVKQLAEELNLPAKGVDTGAFAFCAFATWTKVLAINKAATHATLKTFFFITFCL